MKPILILAVFAFATLSRSADADGGPRLQSCALDTGAHNNTDTEMHRFFSQVVTAETNAGLRVHFRELNLGARSYVQLTSLKDSLTQRLEVANMANWFQTSAAFNGDRVLLELFVAPGESGIRAVVDHLVLPCNCPPPSPEVVPIRIENLCGPDDRAASGDLRIGRTSRGCTAWLISNGAVLSAGHCVPNGAMFMINVPPSNADGVTANSHPDDQYPIVPDSEVMVWDQNSSSTAGDDIDDVIFRLNPDNRGRRAHDRLGLFRVTTAVPPNGTVIRITGYGTDSTPPGPMGGANAQNQTLQTSTGGFVGQFELGVNGTGRILRHAYAVDTESGNSGSPIMWDAKGFTIVIHTAGGCASDGSGSNGGTSFNQPNLRAAVENFPGANTRYPDTVIYPGSPADIGSIFAPDHNLRAAYNRTPSGGIISIVQGAYPRTVIGNTGIFGDDGKSVRIEAPVGPFTIGQ